jgi:rhodanese-related sulfurtransferase
MNNKFALSGLLAAVSFCNSLLAADLGLLNPEQVLEMQNSQQALVVDVRTSPEWQATGVIADSLKLQGFDANGKFDQEKWLSELKQAQSSPDQPVILVCRSGNRSGKIGEILTKQLGMNNVYHLDHGIDSWSRTGHPLAPNCPATSCK